MHHVGWGPGVVGLHSPSYRMPFWYGLQVSASFTKVRRGIHLLRAERRGAGSKQTYVLNVPYVVVMQQLGGKSG